MIRNPEQIEESNDHQQGLEVLRIDEDSDHGGSWKSLSPLVSVPTEIPVTFLV